MKVKPKSLLLWLLALAVVGMVVLYGLFVVQVALKHSPLNLISCMTGSKEWAAWTCKQVLFHKDFSPEEVKDLNDHAGARFPMSLMPSYDPAVAEAVLKRFLSQGVDINAKSVEMGMDWTTLHSAAMEANPAKVVLLLKYGARPDLRDARGETPVDVARDMRRKYPNPGRDEIIHILEEAERKAAAQQK